LPKLTLQPIVENAVLHGIQQKKPKIGTLVISASFIDEGLRITVEDDGVGIEAEQLKQLLLSPSQDKSGSGYGLYNVRERVRLFSQDPKYGLTIRTELGIGTIVEVFISRRSI
jgi:two-component system sensor histidine kinase YesM